MAPPRVSPSGNTANQHFSKSSSEAGLALQVLKRITPDNENEGAVAAHLSFTCENPTQDHAFPGAGFPSSLPDPTAYPDQDRKN